ncbi:VanW family protein [Paenibacillus sp. GSMTC-2017]|uniref:VanW family protein n=1 Tax=Paenibacillus sp. GSMTC-2017 TaxID=2794350 RepID=UPI0018DA0632|nr:VanW family protein [Paenibacillus sp. GSMTC-2017]
MDQIRYRPIKRSKLRLWAGKWYFTTRRYMKWITNRSIIAKRKQKDVLPFVSFVHKTPLMRNLRNVDNWMQRNKVINLKLGAERLDGLILMPGETFSYCQSIGKPTRGKGYVDGMVLFYGGFKSGVGGGLCHLSNLIYWMTLHTSLTVIERHRHSYDVFPDAGRTQPFGSGATCVYNYLDLQIRNESAFAYQLKFRLTDDELIGEWRSEEQTKYKYEIYEKEHQILSQPWGGYIRHNTIYRKVRNESGELITDEFVTENKALMMYAPLLSQA